MNLFIEIQDQLINIANYEKGLFESFETVLILSVLEMEKSLFTVFYDWLV